MTAVAQSYGLACAAAMTIAVGLGTLTKKVAFLQSLGLFVPYVSVITASTANMFFTRMEEVQNGIQVFDADGNK